MLYLSGCATTTSLPKPTSALKPSVLHQQHMEKLANIEQFSLKGRIGVITKPKNFSARLAWQHRLKTDNIDVYSPLGGKVANITKTPELVTLIDSKEKELSAKDAETLTKDTLGFKLPLSGLSHWALGKPGNESIADSMTWDENGRVTTLQQNGWQIEYTNYVSRDQYVLPSKVVLKNNQITIKLVIDKWAEINKL